MSSKRRRIHPKRFGDEFRAICELALQTLDPITYPRWTNEELEFPVDYGTGVTGKRKAEHARHRWNHFGRVLEDFDDPEWYDTRDGHRMLATSIRVVGKNHHLVFFLRKDTILEEAFNSYVLGVSDEET